MRRIQRVSILCGLLGWMAWCSLAKLAQSLFRGGVRAFFREICLIGAWIARGATLMATCSGLPRRLQLAQLCLERFPKLARLHCERGNCLYQLARFEDALRAYGTALELGDSRSSTQGAFLAAIHNVDLQKAKGVEAALAHIEKLHRDCPDCPVIAYNLGVTLLHLQRYERLVEIMTTLLERDPNRAECYAARGLALQQLGQYSPALADLDRCFELDPKQARAKGLNLNRAYLRGLRGESEQGFAALRHQFLPETKDNGNAALAAAMAGRIQHELGRLNIDGTVGIFFGVFPNAVGHAILDPFHFYNLFAHRFDRLVMITPPQESFSPATAIPLKILEPYVDRIESTDGELLNLSWQNLGPLTHRNITFLIYNYWGLNRMAFKARFDPGHPMGERRLYFRLPPKIMNQSERLCKRKGIDLSRPTVVLHAREHAYHNLRGQSYRNTNILNYVPAVRRLIDEGYQVIRIGDKKMTSIQGLVDGVIELPRLDFYQPILDPFLISRCRFMISCQSGPCSYARIFGKPNLVVNAVYHFTLIPEHNELIAFKNYIDAAGRQPLSVEQIMRAGCHLFDRTEHFADQGIEVRDNSPEEILAATEEMLAWHQDPHVPESREQEYFRELMRIHMAAPRGAHPLQTPMNDYIGYALPECRLSDAVTRMRPGFLRLRPSTLPLPRLPFRVAV